MRQVRAMKLVRRNQPESQAADEELCTLREAARILKLNEASIRKRLGGTGHLTHIRRGNPGSQRQRVVLIMSEVVALRREWIAAARAQQGKADKQIYGT